ncbi:MAG TPA: TetR/AcrR family transcriptional regulator [Stellaceae bacterium]|nr:TetR/AcrR family transcriptional regulator [Stellaceae bacterium]
MRISKEEAEANRGRVLAAAARLFREKGVDGIGVADLMREAGLTHGGFYNHFQSKEELAAAAFGAAFAAAIEGLQSRLAKAGPRGRRKALAHYVERYLARETRDRPALSCPMATLGTDAVRHGAAVKAEFAAGVRRYLDLFAELMPSTGARRRREGVATLSTLIGALTLSRACAGADDALADEVLAVVRDELTQRKRSRG